MADKKFPKSNLPIRKSVELLPKIFQTDANAKFMAGVFDPMIQPGMLEKVTGYIGKRYGKTFNSSDIYVDTDDTLRSRYQLEPGVLIKTDTGETTDFYDYLDYKNQLKFFGNRVEADDKINEKTTYTWNPPICWDKFVNFREYYWEPLGPPPVRVAGNAVGVASTYRVSAGIGSSWIFFPDGFSNNPRITLYRGQKYTFKINTPGQPFVIKTNYDTGSLLFDPIKTYFPGQVVLFDNKLWRAKVEVSPADGSTISNESQDWEFIENAVEASSLDYNNGVTNNGTEVGDLIFEVPFDAPDLLFYQSRVDPDKLGQFLIANIDTNSFIDIEKEVLGKLSYTSSNGVEFTNGLIVTFSGRTFPATYQSDNWLIEGVGTAISLVKFSDLVAPAISIESPEVLFDDQGFDTQPFDDAIAFPANKDYITIARNSKDFNSWSRYNRWFHRSVLEYSYAARNQDFKADENLRAKRPIIEFKNDMQLFNHGAIAKQSVDLIDTFTTDVFSIIEGSAGYNVDGEFLFDGARLLVTADTDSLSNNKIYQVKFIEHLQRRQIHLEETNDTVSFNGDGVLIKRGTRNSGLMYYFNGTQWAKSQAKTRVNQPPLFDIFNDQGVSFSDNETYLTSTFVGSPIVSYKIGNSLPDKELGFSLSYLNIDNIGDIQFKWNWEVDSFSYIEDISRITTPLSTGYYKFNNNLNFQNGWIEKNSAYSQNLIETAVLETTTNEIVSTIIDWNNPELQNNYEIIFEVNGFKSNLTYVKEGNKFIFEKAFNSGDVITTKLAATVSPDKGYYEIPLSLEKNPFNNFLESFTYGEASDHVFSSLEFNKEFTGNYPGVSNLRNIETYRNFGKRFLKHPDITPLSMFLLCDKKFNIIKSIRHSAKAYSEFKNNIIKRSTELSFSDNASEFLDNILSQINKVKTSSNAFSGSDMIGTGAFKTISYIVDDDEEITTFSLSEKFNLVEPSARAVYIYVNQQILLHGRDYEFDSNFGFVRLKVMLSEGDLIEIREYTSTEFSFVPATPTKLGLYKKYKPHKFLDNTYLEPREVIQGHDGSITVCFGDYRDDILLEFETRIYNNLKIENSENVNFELDNLLDSYYSQMGYSKSQVDQIISQDFLRWNSNTGLNYSKNDFFDSENAFTFTYSEMTSPDGNSNLPGYWRGVYRWFYDTDRPNRTPWEMLGFSEEPLWWITEYGAAPYTRGNLILWEDLENGIVRQGQRAGQYDRYKRPGLLQQIPVDDNGNLLNPLDSNLAKNFVLINNRGSLAFGDIGPVEYAWRSSSDYPFAIVTALCLLKPLDYIGQRLDKNQVRLNAINQIVDKFTNEFVTLASFSQRLNSPTVGLINYVIDYVKSTGLVQDELYNKIRQLDVKLSSRLSGFVDKGQQKYLLDTKNPKSASSSIFVPPEDYEIFFDESSPIDTLSYSGVIVEKTATGWSLQGYDTIFPFFDYYDIVTSQKDPVISVGGVSASFQNWIENKTYNNGQLALYRGDYYRSLRSHNSGNDFDKNQWTRLPKLPVVGGVEAIQRKNFNRQSARRLGYGTEFKTVQSVVDFLLGYEQFLIDQGFSFDEYDSELQVSRNWSTSAKEFMFWTRHNWTMGAIVSLSPASQKIEIAYPVGVADSLLESFYDYQILKSDGTVLSPDLINVDRTFQKTIISTDGNQTSDGIYLLRISYILKEHVVIFNDTTVFNDVIYDKTTGYRQDRIKSFGFRTVDWDGDYTSPGFLFDNVSIESWLPFKEYRLGDVVSYRSLFWASKRNHLGQEFFDNNIWTKLDSNPVKKLVPNFDYRINLFEDYFEVSSDGVGQVQRDLARHSLGYQPRSYLENLSEDAVTQFQIYQGFIREKGTKNSITKVFDKLSSSTVPSLKIEEEWAIRIGRLGGIDQFNEIEFELNRNKISLNPQPIIYANSNIEVAEGHYKITNDDFSILTQANDNEILPTNIVSSDYLTAGYVRFDQVDRILPSYESFSTLAISDINENFHIWVTYDVNNSWNVYRFNRSELLYVTSVIKNNTEVTVAFNRKHAFKLNEYVGLKIGNLFGFFEIASLTNSAVTFIVGEDSDEPEFDVSIFNPVWALTSVRFNSYNALDATQAALLPNNSKLWIDSNKDGLWEVVEKIKQFNAIQIQNYGITTPSKTGTKVLYDNTNKLVVTSMPGSAFVMTYYTLRNNLTLRQILPPPQGLFDNVIGTFGEELALSPDSKWLFVGSPRANSVPSDYKELFDPLATYIEGDVVLFAGLLFRAKTDIIGDGSIIDVTSQDWEPAPNIPAYQSAPSSGFRNQGVVSVYEFVQQQWTLRQTFVSPRPEVDEHFGHAISIALKDGKYSAAISAPGALQGTGRVYLYDLENAGWEIAQNADYKGVFNNGATFVGNIFEQNNRSFLEVTAVSSTDRVQVGMTIEASGIVPGTVISQFVSGNNGGVGTYLINKLQTVVSSSITGTIFYPIGSIVWYDGNLWQAKEDITGDLSTISLESSEWTKLDNVTTTGSLPRSASIEDDGSTLAEGLLGELQLAELVKKEDRFGSSIAMNYSGDVLIVGAPNSDSQFFTNYRGVWRPDYEYTESDVVKYQGFYHVLVNDGSVPEDSTITSYNQIPVGLPWENIGDSTVKNTGKVFIYEKNQFGRFKLAQTITTDNIGLHSDIDSAPTFNAGDLFGSSVDIDFSASTIVIASPQADINFQNQGSVYVFEKNINSQTLEFRLSQILESYESNPNEYFGQDVKISPNTEKIVVGAKNSPYVAYSMFDGARTTFDNAFTKFYESRGFAGSVYVFEKKDASYFLTEKLQAELSLFESFGFSVDCTDSLIVVGSPNYVDPLAVDSTAGASGTVRLFEKQSSSKSWNTLSQQEKFVDLAKIRGISVYDNDSGTKIIDLDVVDPINNLKILNIADKEIKFKTEYDPAIYSQGNSEVVVDESISWKTAHVGELWWNISVAKWINYNQGDLSYKISNWGKLADGSSITVCEWVESKLLPSEWAILADTTEGTALGISGQPFYANDENYTVKELFNETTGEPTETLYYYWVQNKTNVPDTVIERKLSAADVSILIANPFSLGLAFAALIDGQSILIYNIDRLFRAESVYFNVIYATDDAKTNLSHNKFQIISEESLDDLAPNIEQKWIDSIIGADQEGNRVPAGNLSEKQKYGLSFRPRQTMFKNRISILKDTIEYLNSILESQPFADLIDFTILQSKEEIPVKELNLYDDEIDQDIDLQNVGTVKVRGAVLSVNVVDGEIDTIDVVEPGFGYKTPPPISIQGSGVDAEAVCVLDSQGRVKQVDVLNRGRNYSQTLALVRKFSILVNFDKTQNNLWSIYAWDDVRQVFFRTRTQAFDTARFWSYKTWWQSGYSENSRTVVELDGFYQVDTLDFAVGDLIKISNYGSGGWAVLEKNSNPDAANSYTLVGRENGTIELSRKIYDIAISGVGFDNVRSFDTGLYDVENFIEKRNIFNAIKQDILIGDLQGEWKKLFFIALRYLLAEQPFVDWAFKTSFVKVVHNLGALEKKLNYKNDNLEAYVEYFNEVKPFKTTARKFISKYTDLQNYNSAITDFDLPPTFSKEEGTVLTIDKNNALIDQYPYKWWNDNNGYELVEIAVVNSGSNYTTPPSVNIIGDGTGATARAFISSGKVSKIVVEQPGKNYKAAPQIVLVGGTRNNDQAAGAVAIIGQSKARSFDISIKFDRITKTGQFFNFAKEEIITATSNLSVIDLKYPLNTDKRNLEISVNEETLLQSDYQISLYTVQADQGTNLRGRIIFQQPLQTGNTVKIKYQINDEILDSVNRIERYYEPGAGMKAKEPAQLMTGIDFGGVKIQGTTFDVTGGWDALPWFTDTWDSVSANSDFYFVLDFKEIVDSSVVYKKNELIKVSGIIYVAKKDNITETGELVIPVTSSGWEEYWERFVITLPFIPTNGQRINVYVKKIGEYSAGDVLNLQLEKDTPEPPTIRVDDLYFDDAENIALVSNPNAKMPTIIGDGTTQIIDISQYDLELESLDTLIFRSEDSDGSITINDNNLLDTALSGGTLASVAGAYSTASGITADEIAIEGGKFVSPEQVQSPEENVPGQVLESLSIKVFNNTYLGAAPLESIVRISDGVTTTYKINIKIIESTSIIVYVDKNKKNIDADYTINWLTNSVEFLTAPAIESIIEITAIGIGGFQIIDVQEFVADGDTSLFLTAADFPETSKIFVTVNGYQQDVEFINSSTLLDTVDKTLIQFGTSPAQQSVIKIVCFGVLASADESSIDIVSVNNEQFIYDGSTSSFELTNFINLERGSGLSSVIVEVNNLALTGVDTIVEIYNGTNNSFILGIDPLEAAGSILPSNITVFINNKKVEFIRDYNYDGITKNLTLVSSILSINDIIKIEVDLRTQYSIVNNNVDISPTVSLVDGDTVTVTWFSEYPSLNIASDEFTGGKINYRLKSQPLDIAYVWAYLNGERLVPDVDFYITGQNLYINQTTTDQDSVKIIQFGSNIFKEPVAFEIYQDMLNVTHFKRYSIGELVLAQDLKYYDTEIIVDNADSLYDPTLTKNAGIITVNAEKIAYFKKNGNKLSQLRRGLLGSSIAELHKANSVISDASDTENIPYIDSQERFDFVSDGSSLLIGPLPFVPTKSNNSIWFRSNIPEEFGPCYELEIFVAGKRINKDPVDIFDEELGSYSPLADKKVQAEFSVDGELPFVRLSEHVPAGLRIIVIRKIGRIWYDRKLDTISNLPLIDNENKIAKFIAQQTTKLPE